MNTDPFHDIPRADPLALARLNRWGGDKLVSEMRALFHREVPTRIRAARGAVREGSCDAAERAAHSLKSSCAQLGALRMRALAEEIEVLSSQRSLGPVTALLDRLEDEFTAWLDSTASGDREGEQ